MLSYNKSDCYTGQPSKPNVVLSNVRELAGVLGKLGPNIALDWYLSVILAWMQHVHVSSVSSVKHIA